MKTWLVADWHINDHRLDIMDRPFKDKFEMNRVLQENHNKLVSPDDEVIVVGDVIFDSDSDLLPVISLFNGKKTLIRGNHDRNLSDKEFGPYFEQIISEGDGIERTFAGVDCWITHYPTRGRRDRFNIVGHVHGAWKVQLNMLNVGVDVHHFRPVNSDKMPFYYKAICDFYDEDVWVGYHEQNTRHFHRGKKESYFKE